MNDPHVALLEYQLQESVDFHFQNPPDLEFHSPLFSGRLSNGTLQLRPKSHFASEPEARPVADEFVKAWEICEGLRRGHGVFSFRFNGSQVVDRSPEPGNLSLQTSGFVYITDSARIEVLSPRYPDPPGDFTATPEVEILWQRYSNYSEGHEPLQAMAYFCLTFLEGIGGKRRERREEAGKRFGIEFDVLENLGELSSAYGDMATARKAHPDLRPLSDNQTRWVVAAVKAIIHHLATRRSGQVLQMSDLPPLE